MCQGVMKATKGKGAKTRRSAASVPHQDKEVVEGPNDTKAVSFVSNDEQSSHHNPIIYYSAATPKTSELTEEEMNELWYTKTDLETTRKEILATLKVLKRTASLPVSSSSHANKRSRFRNYRQKQQGEEICSRGLEMQLNRIRKFDMIRTHKALWEEQCRQRDLGINDPSSLAKIYSFKSSEAKEIAIQIAQKDYEEAQVALEQLGGKNDDKKGSKSKSILDILSLSSRSSSPHPRRIRSSWSGETK